MAEEIAVIPLVQARHDAKIYHELGIDPVYVFSSGYWIGSNLDPAHICMVVEHITASKPSYGFSKFTIYSDRYREAVIKAYRKKEKKITLVRIGENIVVEETGDVVGETGGAEELMQEPRLELPVKYMFSGMVNSFFKTLQGIGDTVIFMDDKIGVPTETGTLVLNIHSINKKLYVEWNGEKGWGIYSLNYITVVLPPSTSNIQIYIGRENMPTKISYSLGVAEYTVYIAPRIESAEPEISIHAGEAMMDYDIIAKLRKRLPEYDDMVLDTETMSVYVVSSTKDVAVKVSELYGEILENTVLALNANMLRKIAKLIADYYEEENTLHLEKDRAVLLGVNIGYEPPYNITEILEFIRNNTGMATPVEFSIERKKTRDRIAYLVGDKVYVIERWEAKQVGSVTPATEKIEAVPNLLLPPKTVQRIDTSTPEGLTHGIDTETRIEYWVTFDPDKVRRYVSVEKESIEDVKEKLLDMIEIHNISGIKAMGIDKVLAVINNACNEKDYDTLAKIYDIVPYLPAKMIERIIGFIEGLPIQCRPSPYFMCVMWLTLADKKPSRLVDAVLQVDNYYRDITDTQEREIVKNMLYNRLNEYAGIGELEDLVKYVENPEIKEVVDRSLVEKKRRTGKEKEESAEETRHIIADKLLELIEEAKKKYSEVTEIYSKVTAEGEELSSETLENMLDRLRRATDMMEQVAADIAGAKIEAVGYGFKELVDLAEKWENAIKNKFIKVARDVEDQIVSILRRRTNKGEMRRAEETGGEVREKCREIEDWMKRAEKAKELWQRLRRLLYDRLGEIISREEIRYEDLEEAEKIVREIQDTASKLQDEAIRLVEEYDTNGYAEYAYTCLGDKYQELYNLAFLLRESVITDSEYFIYASKKRLEELRSRANKGLENAVNELYQMVEELAEKHGVTPPSKYIVEERLKQEWRSLEGLSEEELRRALEMIAREIIAELIAEKIAGSKARREVKQVQVQVPKPKPRPVPVTPEKVVVSLTPKDWYYILTGGVRYWWEHVGMRKASETMLPAIEQILIPLLTTEGEKMMRNPKSLLEYVAGYILYEYPGIIVSKGVLHGMHSWWSNVLYMCRNLWRDITSKYNIPYIENVRFIVYGYRDHERYEKINTNGMVPYIYASLYYIYKHFGTEPPENIRRYYRMVQLWKEKGYPEVLEVSVEAWRKW